MANNANDSRLGRLYQLLESTNNDVRLQAAEQIGFISGECRDQLPSLLNKLLPYIKNKTWTVRIAASEALRQIGIYSKTWVPNGYTVYIEDYDKCLISLENLNLCEVLKMGKRLYSTDMKELEGVEVDPLLNSEEIKKHLQFVFPGKDVEEDCSLISNEDLRVYDSLREDNKVNVREVVEKSLKVPEKNKNSNKRCYDKSNVIDEPEYKIFCTEFREENEKEGYAWPWSDICEELLICLWHSKWEVRHGAATALREVIRSQGSVMISKAASSVCRTEFIRCHNLFLEDVVSRIMCTLALDQLSDFVNDEMVAPVRESCAQCLGIITLHLSESKVTTMVTRHLLTLLNHIEWTVTHGALLGLKYVLASRHDMIPLLLPLVYGPICTHLRDSRDDDVRCAAASALMPIFSRIVPVSLPYIDDINSLRSDLWTVLSLRTDYTSAGATGAVLSLLQTLYNDNISLYSLPSVIQISTYLNTLHWCYFNYGETVRLAALRTCRAVVTYYGSRLSDITPETLLQVMVQLYQRVLIDDSQQVRVEAEHLWQTIVEEVRVETLALCSIDKLNLWICCAMQPARLSYSLESLTLPISENNDLNDNKHHFPMDFYIGGKESYLTDGSSEARNATVLQARLAACRCLSILCMRLSSLPMLDEHIILSLLTYVHLKERLALQRFVAATILAFWQVDSQWRSFKYEMLSPLKVQLISCLEEPIYYQELLPQYKCMIKSCRHLLSVYTDHEFRLPSSLTVITATFNLAQCQSLVSQDMYLNLQQKSPSPEDEATFSCAKTSVELCASEHGQLSRLVEVSVARALLTWQYLPQRLTPLIRPLMDSIRTESRYLLQLEAAKALASLVIDCVSANIVAAMGKLVRNLVTYLNDSIESLYPTINLEGVLVLHKVAQLGRNVFPHQEQLATNISEDSTSESGNIEVMAIKMRGAKLALEHICRRMCLNTMTLSLTLVNEIIFHQPMIDLAGRKSDVSIIAGLRSMVICLPVVKKHFSVLSINVIDYAHIIVDHGLPHKDIAVRHWSARFLSTLTIPLSNEDEMDLCRIVLDTIIFERVISSLDHTNNECMALGSIELLYLIMQQGILEHRLALVVLFMPTVLRALNSPNDSVRRTATFLFSLMLGLMPLELHGANISLLTPQRLEQRNMRRDFIDGLLNPDSITSYDVSSFIIPSLRHYQQLGVNWLSFLNRYGLHGVLADDMGLGKTLQTLCIIAGEVNSDPSAVISPSLVVCPLTLTTHWLQEIKKHISLPNFSAVIYNGSADIRELLSRNLSDHHIVITSYEILRKDIDRLRRPPSCEDSPCYWKYLVLDEGHLIRNHKSKLAQAVKLVNAQHRLLLTGTPIQNKVAELWSLFDFLMPGLLGSHTDFHRQYGRLLSHSASTCGKKVDTETGTLALANLHKQVLPFMLRRLKEDVLHELPPKIIQDYICHMTPLQQKLHSTFLGSSAGSSVTLSVYREDSEFVSLDQRKHVFHALHYLRLVCNHPSLVLSPSHPLYQSVTQDLISKGISINDVNLSGKLVALKQLILDCGIASSDEDNLLSTVVSSHRLLLFCQSKLMISLVQKMLSTELPRASFLTMDGTVAIKDRERLIDTFNNDPSFDILLLTTGVGGLGLNLTSADTVVFIEHDWNPMKDLQAMDRAHRIGQRRVVNVYRLITADSIEERIMNLQQFKMFIANEVVSGDNKDLGSMNTHSLLDIMDKDRGGGDGHRGKEQGNSGLKSMLTKLGAVYDSRAEYEDEYSLENYVKML